jgi:hypothetical protein
MRIDYLDIPGLRVGGSFTYNHAKGDSTSNLIKLFELHGKYEGHNIITSAEYGMINYGSGNVEESMGYYIDFGYDFSSLLDISTQIIPFVRYADLNPVTKAGTGGNIEEQYHVNYWQAGFSIKPIQQIVFKFDYGVSKNQLTDLETTLINGGVGYMF